jgi:TPR repeat protein
MPRRRPDTDAKRREITNQLLLAEQGEAAVQNIIGAKLAQGYFVKRDLAGALYWYAQAVKQGYTYAKWNAGTMLIAGEGVEGRRIELGVELIEQAADCGDASACDFLAQCYAKGTFGKVRDPVMSAKWSERAREHVRFVEYGLPFHLDAHGITLLKPKVEWS